MCFQKVRYNELESVMRKNGDITYKYLYKSIYPDGKKTCVFRKCGHGNQ